MQEEKSFPPATLEKISEILIASDQIPLLGAPSPFPWDDFTSLLSKLFDGKEVHITRKPIQWKTREELHRSMGDDASSTFLLLSPLDGDALWIMPKADIHKLTSSALFKNGETKGFLSAILEEGYFRYLVLDALSLLSKMELFSPFSLKISETTEPNDNAYLCQDLHLKIDSQGFMGRVAISSSLQKSWQQHFLQECPRFPEKIASSLELTLSLQTKPLSLLPSLWKKISLGDFLLLDSLDYDPKKGKTSLLVALGTLPLFQATVQKDSVELINHASFHEETSMEDNNHSSNETEVALSNIPLHIVVEIGRIPITLQKLTELQSGNFLQIPSFDNKVSLLVGGKKLGAGELVYIGDALGVRITEIS